MRNEMFITWILQRHYKDDQIKEDEIDLSCNAHEK
jgi:hypothetical protein